MPVMLPPGQGVSVTLPNSAPPPPPPPPTQAKSQPSPQPFVHIKGPAVTILPHLPPEDGDASGTPPPKPQM